METQSRIEWSIGELAASAGVTVRALHHYDRIGLLTPAERSLGGHRRYTPDEVERLYRIVALRDLGFSLADIATMLEAERGQLSAIVGRQLAVVDAELEQRTRLRDRLARMLAYLERAKAPSPEELIETMEEISMPIKIDRVYTRSGDAGETELADGTRIVKTDPRLEAADLEELSAHIGVVAARDDLSPEHAAWLTQVQNDLFDIGAELARRTPVGDDSAPQANASYVEWLEDRCDEANRELAPLESFVLPGGTALAAQVHVCRTVCRRVERRVLAIDDVSPEIASYLNRLSDLLFVLARTAAVDHEQFWKPGRTGERR